MNSGLLELDFHLRAFAASDIEGGTCHPCSNKINLHWIKIVILKSKALEKNSLGMPLKSGLKLELYKTTVQVKVVASPNPVMSESVRLAYPTSLLSSMNISKRFVASEF